MRQAIALYPQSLMFERLVYMQMSLIYADKEEEFLKILSMSLYSYPSKRSPRSSGYHSNIVFPNTTSWLTTIYYLTIGLSISYDKGVSPAPKNGHRFGHQSSF